MPTQELSPSDSECSVSDSESEAEVRKIQLKDLAIAISGKLPGYNHEQIKEMVEDYGARFVKNKIDECTHLITTAECYGNRTHTIKIQEAMKSLTCNVVSFDWLSESIGEGQPLDVEEFLIDPHSKRFASASSESNSQSHRKRKTRSASISIDIHDESAKQVYENDLNSESHRKRNTRSASRIDSDDKSTEEVNDNVLIEFSTLSAMVDKASYKAEEGKGEKLAVLKDGEGVIWDATLVEDLSALKGIRDKKWRGCCARITRMQVIVDTQKKTYYTLKRHTSLTLRRNCLRSDDCRLQVAVANFEKDFESLTGLPWTQRTDPPKDMKAIFIQFENKGDQSHEDLPSAVCDALKKLVNLDNLSDIEASLLDHEHSPLLQKRATSIKHSVQTASALLRKICEVQKQPQNDNYGAKRLETRLIECFLRLFWPAGKVVPIGNVWISDSRKSIDGLLEFRSIKERLKSPGKLRAPLLHQIYALLQLTKMSPLKQDTTEYLDIIEYFKQSYGDGYNKLVTLLNVFQIERPGEAQQFSQWIEEHKSDLSERRLLWHGSRVSQFPGILRNGLRPNNRTKGAPGISFAETTKRAAGDCLAGSGQHAFLLLCEVELGKECGPSDCNNSGNHRIIEDPHGIKYQSLRDANFIHKELQGVNFPDFRPGSPSGSPEPEPTPSKKYVIMDTAQIRERYLFHFMFN